MSVRFHESVQQLLVPLDDVKPWPNNPRSGDIAELKKSIQKNGFYGAVIVQRSTGFVIAGNHRRQALEELGSETIPVLYVDVDDTEAARLALADNRTSDLAMYDDEALFQLLDHLVRTDTLEGTGYDRASYELLLQGMDGDQVGGVRQGLTPEERIDQYNELDIRSIILPYGGDEYEAVASGLATLRKEHEFDSNADVVAWLVQNALS
jgi:hypothetical protein